MKKEWLFKLITLNQLEDIAQLSEQLKQPIEPLRQASTDALKQTIEKQLQELSDKAINAADQLFWQADGKDLDAQQRQWLLETLPNEEARLKSIARNVAQITQPTISQEWLLYNQQLPWGNWFGELQDTAAAIVPTVLQKLPFPNFAHLNASLAGQHVVIEADNLLLSNPLKWLLVTAEAISVYVQQQRLIERVSKSAGDIAPILNGLVSLRLLGPAYYLAFVINAIRQAEWNELLSIEPVLFDALNHFNAIEPSLVFIHQSVESIRPLVAEVHPPQLEASLQQELFKVLEQQFGEKHIFNGKQFARRQALLNRLQKGILIAAHPASISVEHQADIEQANEPLSSFIQGVAEKPVSHLEIINAGWLHKIAIQDGLYSSYLALENNTMQPKTLQRTVLIKSSQLNALLLRSVEIASLHKLLALSDEPTISAKARHPQLV